MQLNESKVAIPEHWFRLGARKKMWLCAWCFGICNQASTKIYCETTHECVELKSDPLSKSLVTARWAFLISGWTFKAQGLRRVCSPCSKLLQHLHRIALAPC